MALAIRRPCTVTTQVYIYIYIYIYRDVLFRQRPSMAPLGHRWPPLGHRWPLQMAEYRLCFRGNISFFLNNAESMEKNLYIQLILVRHRAALNCVLAQQMNIVHKQLRPVCTGLIASGQDNLNVVKPYFPKTARQNFKLFHESIQKNWCIQLILVRHRAALNCVRTQQMNIVLQQGCLSILIPCHLCGIFQYILIKRLVRIETNFALYQLIKLSKHCHSSAITPPWFTHTGTVGNLNS